MWRFTIPTQILRAQGINFCIAYEKIEASLVLRTVPTSSWILLRSLLLEQCTDTCCSYTRPVVYDVVKWTDCMFLIKVIRVIVRIGSFGRSQLYERSLIIDRSYTQRVRVYRRRFNSCQLPPISDSKTRTIVVLHGPCSATINLFGASCVSFQDWYISILDSSLLGCLMSTHN